MSLNLSSIGTQKKRVDIPLPKAANQPGRVLQVISIGSQKREFKGEVKTPVAQLMIAFELVNSEYDHEGEPRRHILRPRPFNLLSDEKATIVKFMKGIDPSNTTKGDLSKLINMPALVQVVHAKYTNKEGKDIPVANFGGVSEAPEGFPVKELKSEPIVFDFYEPDADVLSRIPKWIVDKMKESVDYPSSKVKKLVEELEANSGANADTPY